MLCDISGASQAKRQTAPDPLIRVRPLAWGSSLHLTLGFLGLVKSEDIDMKSPVIQTPEQAARPLNVGGFQITVLASTERTGGYEMFRIAGPEGTGPGPHYHQWDESFFVLSGAVHCGVGDLESLATKGTLIHVPGGSVHWFRFAEGGGEFFSITSQGNASNMFDAFDKGINWANPDRSALIELAAQYGQTVLPKI